MFELTEQRLCIPVRERVWVLPCTNMPSDSASDFPTQQQLPFAYQILSAPRKMVKGVCQWSRQVCHRFRCMSTLPAQADSLSEGDKDTRWLSLSRKGSLSPLSVGLT